MTPDAALVFSSTTDSAISQTINPQARSARAGARAAAGRRVRQISAYRNVPGASLQAFPAGCLFISEVDSQPYHVFVRGAVPGALTSFARAAGRGAIPRAGSSSGGLCRVASGTDLALITSRMGRVPSFNDLAPGAMMRGAAR